MKEKSNYLHNWWSKSHDKLTLEPLCNYNIIGKGTQAIILHVAKLHRYNKRVENRLNMLVMDVSYGC